MNHLHLKMLVIQAVLEERCGSVVECLTRDGGIAGSSLTGNHAEPVLFS